MIQIDRKIGMVITDGSLSGFHYCEYEWRYCDGLCSDCSVKSVRVENRTQIMDKEGGGEDG